MVVIDNFLRNTETIVEFCLENPHLFEDRVDKLSHEGPLPVASKFSSLKTPNIPEWLVSHIFENGDWDEDLKDIYFFIQIQRYLPGEYIVPHKDNYSVVNLHLVNLTTSDVDGLIYLTDDDGLIKIYDKAGQKLDGDMNNFHWVDPVKDIRFTLVITE